MSALLSNPFRHPDRGWCSYHAIARKLLPLGLLVWMLAPLAAQQRYVPPPRQSDQDPPKVPGFGPPDGRPPIPGFGLGDDAWATAVTAEDIARANERLQRYDANRDGYIDGNELRSGQWYGDPYQYDANRDGRLSRIELARRYAERRLAESGQRPASGSSSSWDQQRRERERREQEQRDQERRDQERRDQERRDQERRGGSAGIRPTRESWHLAQILIARHDLDRDGSLDLAERRAMGVESAAGDSNRDRRIDTGELATWLAQQEAERGVPGQRELPDWFLQSDSDGDGQVQMSEFVAGDQWTDEKLEEFVAYDANSDGIIVADEVLHAVARMNREHADYQFRILPTRGVVRARIEVADRATIADLDVQLSITHTHVDHLDAYLFGPEGQQVELFTGVGGTDDHFDNTILDDEAPAPIVRGRPPFTGRYHTEARSKGQPGLKQFNGQSMEGTWTLMIEAKSDRPGALHSWALIFKPVEGEATPPNAAEFD